MKDDVITKGLVSIIVPVYNVKAYLPECMDAILSQTYRNMEIILIDDGSTDGSGKRCDDYAQVDKRIRVFHTENGGLSAARNVGLDNMRGEFCAFVDSDDWIESDMMDSLVKEAISTDADFVQCGVIDEYDTRSKRRPLVNERKVVLKDDIITKNIIDIEIENYAWNKLYKASLFKSKRFIVGRNYEDIELTQRLIRECRKAVLLPECYYHYRQREGAISKSFELNNLFDLWKAYYERYEAYCGLSDDLDRALIKPCVHAAGTIWVWTNRASNKQREVYFDEYVEISCFIRDHYKAICKYNYSVNYRIKAFFSKYNKRWAFCIMDYIGRLNSLLKQ